MTSDICKELEDILGHQCVKQNEPMKNHTTFRIGGPADIFVTPTESKTLAEAVALCERKAVPYYIIGNGSNLLVGDGGFRGVIFQIYKTLDRMDFRETEDGWLKVKAGAGIMLVRLAKEVSSRGYTGFEFATGIPGTLGGAVTMNAGAYGGEIRDSIVAVEVMDKNGRIFVLDKKELKLGYRTSVIQSEGYVVLSAEFVFKQGDMKAVQERVDELTEQRKSKQPLEYPSAGSTFKRPDGYFAGKLIQDAGLKGFRVGDAMVSEKHSGFVINIGEATAEDVRSLMEQVNQRVKEAYGVSLEPEVRMIGEFL